MAPEELHETTSYILQATQAMDDVLHDLNTILSTRSTINEKMERFSMNDIVTSVCINLKKEIEESGTTIFREIDPNADQLVSIKSYMQSAVFNLISNAIKYRSWERPPVINVTVTKKNARTVIVIGDNGIGMDLNTHRQRLFVLYSRLNTEREGKGLGLYMTKTQIESLNGSLEVESEEGIGTKFTITI